MSAVQIFENENHYLAEIKYAGRVKCAVYFFVARYLLQHFLILFIQSFLIFTRFFSKNHSGICGHHSHLEKCRILNVKELVLPRIYTCKNPCFYGVSEKIIHFIFNRNKITGIFFACFFKIRKQEDIN